MRLTVIDWVRGDCAGPVVVWLYCGPVVEEDGDVDLEWLPGGV